MTLVIRTLGLVHVCASSDVVITHIIPGTYISVGGAWFSSHYCAVLCVPGAFNSSSGAASSPLVGVVIHVDTAVVVVYPLKICTTWYGLILSVAER